MKMKSIVLLAVAMGCGLVAMIGVQKVLSGGSGNDGVAKVLVATVEVPPGALLNEENSLFKEWPAGAVPQGAVTSKKQIEDRALRVRAVPGEVIMEAKLSPKGELGAANDIPKGMRIVTVSVDSTMTAAGMIMPGDYVDVLVTYKAKSGTSYSEKVKTVLEDVQVFARGNQRDIAGVEEEEKEKNKTLTFLVLPPEVSILKLAESKGKIHVSLRPRGDRIADKEIPDPEKLFADLFEEGAPKSHNAAVDGENPIPQADVAQFLNTLTTPQKNQAEEAPQEQVEEEPPKWKIEIFTGDKLEVVEVELPEDENAADKPEVKDKNAADKAEVKDENAADKAESKVEDDEPAEVGAGSPVK
jgi:pilus assembly protein CpaB